MWTLEHATDSVALALNTFSSASIEPERLSGWWPAGNTDELKFGKRYHVALAAKTRGPVNEFHAAAIAAGGTDNGAPGPRKHYSPTYYGMCFAVKSPSSMPATNTAETRKAPHLSIFFMANEQHILGTYQVPQVDILDEMFSLLKFTCACLSVIQYASQPSAPRLPSCVQCVQFACVLELQ